MPLGNIKVRSTDERVGHLIEVQEQLLEQVLEQNTGTKHACAIITVPVLGHEAPVSVCSNIPDELLAPLLRGLADEVAPPREG